MQPQCLHLFPVVYRVQDSFNLSGPAQLVHANPVEQEAGDHACCLVLAEPALLAKCCNQDDVETGDGMDATANDNNSVSSNNNSSFIISLRIRRGAAKCRLTSRNLAEFEVPEAMAEETEQAARARRERELDEACRATLACKMTSEDRRKRSKQQARLVNIELPVR